MLDRTEPHIADCLAKVEALEFPTSAGGTAFGLFYPPCNPDYAPAAARSRRSSSKCHGRPTSAASSTLNLGINIGPAAASPCST